MDMEVMTEKQFQVFSKRYNQPNLKHPLKREPIPLRDEASDDQLYRYCNTCLKCDIEDSKLIYMLMSRTGHHSRADAIHDWYHIHEKPEKIRRNKRKADNDQVEADGDGDATKDSNDDDGDGDGDDHGAGHKKSKAQPDKKKKAI
jgi:hypothetical protein